MPQRSFQLSPSCLGTEKTVFQVSGPCPPLGQCPCVSPCCKPGSSAGGSVVEGKEEEESIMGARDPQ